MGSPQQRIQVHRATRFAEYRPLSILPVVERLWGSMVVRHLRLQLPAMAINQFAQPGRQPQEGLLFFLDVCLLSQADLLNVPVAILKVDVRKTFDSLRHSAIVPMLRARSGAMVTASFVGFAQPSAGTYA
eukprot:4832831-Amphidinium_carterae.3